MGTPQQMLFGVMKSGRIRWAGHAKRMGQQRGVYRVSVGKPDRKRLLGLPRRRWEDKVKVDINP